MTTTLNKLDYLDETKQQIKNALNTKFNSQIQDADTFRSYVSKISNIYTNWPKVTSENTSLSLTPTKKGLMALNLKGNTSQSGTPTPETPQDIHVVSGDNEIVVTGKNLFKPLNNTSYGITTTYDKNGVGTIKGTSTSKWTNISANVIYSYPAGNYVLSIDKPKTFNVNIKGTYTDKEIFEFPIFAGSKTKNVAFKKEVYSMYAYISGFEAGATFNETIKIQLEKGSIATDNEPYIGKSYPIYLGDIELCKIGDYQDYIYKDNNKWYIHKEIGKVILNGSENIVENSSVKGRFDILTINNVKGGDANNPNAMSNYYKSNYANVDGSIYASNSKFVSFVDHRYKNNLSGLKTWLKEQYDNGTPVKVQYVLATPTYTEITDSTLISQLEALKIATSYDTQTNITQTNDNLPFIINASALMKGGN